MEKTRKGGNPRSGEPVLKHGPNTACGGNAHKWAYSSLVLGSSSPHHLCATTTAVPRAGRIGAPPGRVGRFVERSAAKRNKAPPSEHAGGRDEQGRDGGGPRDGCPPGTSPIDQSRLSGRFSTKPIVTPVGRRFGRGDFLAVGAATEFPGQRNDYAVEGDSPIFADTKIGTVPL